MSLNRYATRRDDGEEAIVNHLRNECGCKVWRLNRPVDLLVQAPENGALLLIEVKSPGGRLTDSQKQFLEDTRGSPVYVVRSPQEARAVVATVSAIDIPGGWGGLS